jgi:hypothetical protein
MNTGFNVKNKFEHGILYGWIKLTFWQKLRWLFGSRLEELRSPALDYCATLMEMEYKMEKFGGINSVVRGLDVNTSAKDLY